MEMIQHIQYLLFKHNCVVIPELGGFIAEIKHVEIHPITHRLTPPSKRLAFNAQLTINDGLLQSTIAREENISMTDAMDKIRKFVAEVIHEIRSNGNFLFPEIGKLYYNKDYKLEFEPDTLVNYLEDSFGFQEIFFKPLETKLVDMSSSQKPVRPVVRKPITPNPDNKKALSSADGEKKGSALRTTLLIIPIILLVGAGGLFVYTKNNNMDLAGFDFINGKSEKREIASEEKKQLAEEPKVDEEATEDVAEAPAIEEISTEIGGNTIFNSTNTENKEESEMDENPAKQNLVDKQKGLSNRSIREDIGTSTAEHGRYFVIVGSFISRDNAYKLRNQVAKFGSSVTVIEPTPDDKFYKVAIADFSSKAEALRKKNELVTDFGSSVWVMSY